MSGLRMSRRRLVQQGGTGIAVAASGVARVSATQTAAAAAPGVTPSSVAAAVDQLDEIAQQALEQTGVPGLALAVVYRDEVVHLVGFGVREAGGGEPVDADTVFQLASVSKPIASTVVAAVVGDDLATWDTRITNLDPDFALFDPWVTREVTLRDMFAHRSGLPHHAGDDLEDLGFDREAVLHRLRHLRPETSFRSAYAYTNFGLTAAAVAAAKAAERSWEDLSAARLYQPLGMTSTSSRLDDFLAAANRTCGHVLVDGAYVAKYQRHPDAQSPAGGVSSTVRDMAQWLRLQLGNGTVGGEEIVAAEALAETHRPQIISGNPANPATDRASFYGLGWGVSYDVHGRVRWSHSGGFSSGAATTVYLLPADELGIVVLTNAAPIGVPESIAFSFLDLAQTGTIAFDYLEALQPIFAAEFGPLYGTHLDYTVPPASPEPALALDAYVGAFDNDYFGEIEVVTVDDGLVIRMGPKQTAYPLRHYDRDVFLYQPVGENAGGESGVTFAVGADGQATSVTIENLDRNRQGTFARVSPAE